MLSICSLLKRPLLRAVMVNFTCLDILLKHYSGCFREGVFGRDLHFNQRAADCPPYCGWASSNQSKALTEQRLTLSPTHAALSKKDFRQQTAFGLTHSSLWASGLPAYWQNLDLPALTIW